MKRRIVCGNSCMLLHNILVVIMNLGVLLTVTTLILAVYTGLFAVLM